MTEQDRVAAQTVGEDGSRQRYHQGDYPHIIPGDLNEAEEQTLALHRATIHAPTARPRFGHDEDGNPIEVGPQGLIITDPETGAVEPLTEESLARSEKIHALRAEGKPVPREVSRQRGSPKHDEPAAEPRRSTAGTSAGKS